MAPKQIQAKRILLITDIFPPDIGGPATYIAELAAVLSQRGYLVTVFCRTEITIIPDDSVHSFNVIRHPRKHTFAATAGLMLSLARQVARHDIILANGLQRQTRRVCALLHRRYTLKVVGDPAWEYARRHQLTELDIDAFQSAPVPPPLRKVVHQRDLYARQAHRVITPSDYLRRMVAGWGCTPDRTTVVPNGVRLDAFCDSPPRRRHPGEALRVLFAGRFVDWKGIDHLLAAVDGVSEVVVTLIGDGPERDRIEAYSHGTPYIHLAGRLSHAEALRHMQHAHLLALPSAYEGLSHTLIEACASGLPCITSERGGNPEVIHDGNNGLIAAYGDVDGLRQAIIRLRDDENLRLRLAQNARSSVNRFDFDRTVDTTLHALTSS